MSLPISTTSLLPRLVHDAALRQNIAAGLPSTFKIFGPSQIDSSSYKGRIVPGCTSGAPRSSSGFEADEILGPTTKGTKDKAHGDSFVETSSIEASLRFSIACCGICRSVYVTHSCHGISSFLQESSIHQHVPPFQAPCWPLWRPSGYEDTVELPEPARFEVLEEVDQPGIRGQTGPPVAGIVHSLLQRSRFRL